VIPLIIQHAMAVCKVPHSVYSTDPVCMARTQIDTAKKYGYDGIHITTDNQVLLEAFGGIIHFPHDEPPQILKRALSEKNLSKLPK
jgi:uroporphyrinogen-III decarboxylase